MKRESKWRDWGGKWDNHRLQFDDFRKLRPKLFKIAENNFCEPLHMLNARIRSHSTVQVFGLPICSGCSENLVEEEIPSPFEGEKINVWSCPKGCIHNRWIRLKPCCTCGSREGRYMIDSRFCRGLTISSVNGYWSACRACGAFGDPEGRTIEVLENDPILTQVFRR